MDIFYSFLPLLIVLLFFYMFVLTQRKKDKKNLEKQDPSFIYRSKNYTQNTQDQDDLKGLLLTASVKFQWSNEFVYKEPAKGTIKFFLSEITKNVMFDYTLKSRSLRATVGETIPVANLHLVESSIETKTIEFRNPDSSKTTLKIIPLSVFDALRISTVFKENKETVENPENSTPVTDQLSSETKSITDSSKPLDNRPVLEHSTQGESPFERFERLKPKFAEDPRIQSVLKLNFDTHNPPEVIKEFFEWKAEETVEEMEWLLDDLKEFDEHSLSQTLYSLMRLGWTITQGLVELRGGSVLSFDQGPIESGIEFTISTSEEEWEEIVERQWEEWTSYVDSTRYMSDLSDEAFYCLFTLQNFGGVETYLGIDSDVEEKLFELETLLDVAKYALLYGVVCLVALRDLGSHRNLETPEILN